MFSLQVKGNAELHKTMSDVSFCFYQEYLRATAKRESKKHECASGITLGIDHRWGMMKGKAKNTSSIG
jgi:hypothetical protein